MNGLRCMTSIRTNGRVLSRMAAVLAYGVMVLAAPVAGADEAVDVRVLEDTPDRIVLQYELGDYTLTPVLINGQEYVDVALGRESVMKIKGAPALPNVCRSIIIPGDARMAVNIVESKSQYHDVQDVLVAPSKGFLPRTVNPEDVAYTFSDVYQTDGFWPGVPASLRDPFIQRDHRGVVVEFNPFQYNPATHTLRVYTTATLEVVNVGLGQINVLDPTRRSRRLSLAFHKLYKNRFLNYTPNTRYAPLDEVGTMLVIYHDPWASNIQPFVDHKNAISIATTAVAVSTIGNNATSIANYIQDEYNTGDLAFVLLVGDAAQVDTPYASGGSADPTYALVAGGDNYPDIFIGRFSAETAAQVDTQVERTIEYETMPATQQAWFKRGMGVASNQGPGHHGEYDDEHMDLIRDDLLAYGYTVVDQIYDPTATAAQVTTALNAGRGIANYCGHGSTTSWSTTGFSNSHVNNLVNDNMLPFIVSVACVNGRFDGYTCFGEAWLRATNGTEPTGAIGAYMSSINQSWDPPMTAQDEAVDMLVAESYFSFGALCFAGSCLMIDEYGSGGVSMFNTWHVFGDPSVRVVGVAQPATGLWVTPSSGFEADGPVGGPFSPGSMVYTLENLNSNGLDYTVTHTEPWVSLDNAGGSLPARGTSTVTVSINSVADGLAHGTYGDVIEFTNVTDHDGDTTRDVTLQVGGPAWDPVAYDVAATTPLCVAVDVTLGASDPNGDPLTYTIESLPASGALSDPGAGAITSVPYELVGGGHVVVYEPPCVEALVDTFTFSARDLTAGSNVAVATITVGGPAWDPVAYNVEWSTGMNIPTDIPLSGTDPNGDPLTYIIESLPAQGAISDPGAGAITAVPYELVGGANMVHYEPPPGQNLQVTFDFSVRDATAGSNIATVTLMVGGPSIVYHYPMDSDPGWSKQGDWAFGQPTGGGGEFGGPDPTAGHFGNDVYGYNLNGDYTNSMPTRYLTTPWLDFTGATGVELRFWRWLGVESSLFDHAKVQVCNDPFGGAWTTLWENGVEHISDTEWTEMVFDLSALADEYPMVSIRWVMGSTSPTNTYCGWNIDDIEIWALVAQPESCEDGVQNQGEARIDCGGPCPPCDCMSNGECDDGLFCTGLETCNDYGHCQPGTPVDCDDGLGCTVDSCDEVDDVCVNAVSNGLCDDGEFCNGAEICDPILDCLAGEYPCGPDAWCDEGDDACIPHGSGDFDGDGDVDLGDFADFQVCFDQPSGLGCEPGNMTGTDAMIDLDDFAAFVAVLNGPQ